MDLKKLEAAGRILEEALSLARNMLDTTYLELAERVEAFIREKAAPAFPCNLSTDREAAHYTPSPDDRRPLGGVLKVDCGVHVDGHIADAAFTVDLTGEHGKLVEAAEEALAAAISVMRAGVTVKEVGRAVEEVARRYGFRPVENLGGHSLEVYRLHAGLFVPNVPRGGGVLREGMVVAVEPFISEGRGFVLEGNRVEIYSVAGRSRNPRGERVRKLLEERFDGLPFARRWIEKEYHPWLRLLTLERAVQPYPVLFDPGGMVAQAEATVVVEKEGVRVIASGIGRI